MLVDNDAPRKPKEDPVEAPDHTTFIVSSLRALMNGTATAHQQKSAMEYIVNDICGTYDLAYRPKSERDTIFALGKQRVGQIITWLLQEAPTKSDPDKTSARSAGEIANEEEPEQ